MDTRLVTHLGLARATRDIKDVEQLVVRDVVYRLERDAQADRLLLSRIHGQTGSWHIHGDLDDTSAPTQRWR